MESSYYQIFIKEVGKTDVIIARDRYKFPWGMAWVEDGRIKIPYLNDLFRLAVAFHELGHIRLNHAPGIVDDPVEEYEAEVFAIRKLRKYNLHKGIYYQEYRQYISKAKRDVEQHIRHYLKRNRSGKVPYKVRKWCGYTK